MSASRKAPEELEHPIIHTGEELEAHGHLDPAYLLISAVLVRGVFILERGRTMKNDAGELLRGIESILVGVGEPETGLMLTGARQVTLALKRLVINAQLIPDELLPVIPGRTRPTDSDEDDPSDDEDDPIGGLH